MVALSGHPNCLLASSITSTVGTRLCFCVLSSVISDFFCPESDAQEMISPYGLVSRPICPHTFAFVQIYITCVTQLPLDVDIFHLVDSSFLGPRNTTSTVTLTPTDPSDPVLTRGTLFLISATLLLCHCILESARSFLK